MLRDNDFINGFDIERILGDLPIDIIKENIKSQINDPLTFMTNHCDQVYETLDEAMDEIGHIDEYRYELQELRDDFNSFLVLELNEGFGLGIDVDNLQTYEIEDVGKQSYDFFVVNLRENITNFLKNYICLNKSELASIFNDEYKRKDVTTNNMKKLTKNKDDVIILSNIISILYHVLDLDLDPEDFMELAVEPGEYSGEYIKECVRNFKIANNFVGRLFNEIKYTHNDVIDEFASEICLELQNNLVYNENEEE
jgi:hypothetical protein